MTSTTTARQDGPTVLARVRASFGQWLQAADVAALAADARTRLTPVLVRCGGCRFVVPADQAQHLIDIITREGSDYVRDASLART